MTNKKMIELALTKSKREPFNIYPSLLLKHTAIFAQSGFGKSFMLGRLIEEILLKTKGNLIIFDPNSDFIRLLTPDPDVWTDSKLNKWFFPNESGSDFAKKWKNDISLSIASNRNLEKVNKIVIDWGRLTDAEIAALLNIDTINDAALYWYIVLARQISLESWEEDEEDEEYYDFEYFLKNSEQIVEYITSGVGPEIIKENPLAKILRASSGGKIALQFWSLVESLAEYNIWRSKGDDEDDLLNLVDTKKHSHALVIDLQSLENEEERLLIINRVLNKIWNDRKEEHWEATRDIDIDQDDNRVPNFILIDEVHNFVPDHSKLPAIKQVSDQIIRIAAEGRKYGLYLYIATQRPKKINQSVLSECDNLFLMKINNENDLVYIKGMLGISGMKNLKKAKKLSVGDIIFFGNVNSRNSILHVSPLRTLRGGKNLDYDYWIKT